MEKLTQTISQCKCQAGKCVGKGRSVRIVNQEGTIRAGIKRYMLFNPNPSNRYDSTSPEVNICFKIHLSHRNYIFLSICIEKGFHQFSLKSKSNHQFVVHLLCISHCLMSISQPLAHPNPLPRQLPPSFQLAPPVGGGGHAQDVEGLLLFLGERFGTSDYSWYMMKSFSLSYWLQGCHMHPTFIQPSSLARKEMKPVP